MREATVDRKGSAKVAINLDLTSVWRNGARKARVNRPFFIGMRDTRFILEEEVQRLKLELDSQRTVASDTVCEPPA